MSVQLAEPEYLSPDEVVDRLFAHDHWDVGRQIINAGFKPNARLAIKGCHSSSKTFSVVDLILLSLYEGGDVITTAPTDDQVRGVLWQQIHDTLQDSKVTGWGDILQKEIKLADGAWAIGRSTNRGVRFHGYHARPDSFLLIVMEEAPGIPPDIFNAADGISSGGDVRIVMLGNPDIPSGPFYDAFTKNAAQWDRISIDAFDNPNLEGLEPSDLLKMTDEELDDNPRPYLATRRWVRDMLIKWGEDDPRWESKVRGRFPKQSPYALIWLSWLEDMLKGFPEYKPELGDVEAAVDVAGPGDNDTVAGIKQQLNVLDGAAFASADARGDVLAFLRPWKHKGLKRVRVDVSGMGWYFARALQDDGYQILNYNAGAKLEKDEKSEDNGKTLYHDRRTRDMWNVRKLLMAGDVRGQLPPEAIEQMTAPLWSINPRGEIAAETKDDMAKRGVESPDWLDMMAMLFAPASRADRLAEAYQKQVRA